MTGHATALAVLLIVGILRWRQILDRGEASTLIFAITALMYAIR